MRLINNSKELVDGKPIYVSSNSLPVKALNLEPAGHAFHCYALRLLGQFVEAVKEDAGKKEVSNEKENGYVQSSDSYSSSKGKKKSSGESKQQDHYALLGLSHLRYLAADDQIRKSYRDAALRYHPDKQAALLLGQKTEAAKQAIKDEIENHFKAIQEAYEVLIDPVRRRIYDSKDEFDDEIPHDCAVQDFFEVFGPAFLRNSRWSINQPVPTLGDDKTLVKEVDSFYDFWYSFKSWREFPHADEHDLEEAESREEKRWMERQNAKLAEKSRKEEYTRVRTLVDNAYKRDPRVARRKEELKAEKRRKKDEKHLAKRLEEAAAAKIAEEERQKKEEEVKRAAEAASNQKKLKEKEKKLLRKERARLRTFSVPILTRNLLGLSDDDVEGLCSSLDKKQLRNLCDRMEGKDEVEKAILIRQTIDPGYKLKDENGNEKSFQQIGSVALNGEAVYSNSNSTEKREKSWNKEEIKLLRNGVQKSPLTTREDMQQQGLANGNMVEGKAVGSGDLQESSTQKSGSNLNLVNGTYANGQISDDSNAAPSNGITSISDEEKEEEMWSDVQEKMLIKALKTFPKDANKRWERVAAAVPGKTINQCKKRFASVKNFGSKKNAV